MQEIKGLKEIIETKAGVLCDLWGVLHDGHHAFSGALRALEGLRHKKVPVVLLSNSPKPSGTVSSQIEKLGIDPGLFRAIVSSGEMVRKFLAERADQSFFFIGWERDRILFEDLPNPERDDLRAADFILCTGFFEDWDQNPTLYEPFLAAGVEAQIPLICANPDLEVFIGDKKVLCAGLLAQTYKAMGGEVLLFGKPETIAYETCFEILGPRPDKQNFLAIGDNLETDILGANRNAIESLFIANGLHGKPGQKREDLDRLIKTFKISPDYFMPKLDW